MVILKLWVIALINWSWGHINSAYDISPKLPSFFLTLPVPGGSIEPLEASGALSLRARSRHLGNLLERIVRLSTVFKKICWITFIQLRLWQQFSIPMQKKVFMYVCISVFGIRYQPNTDLTIAVVNLVPGCCRAMRPSPESCPRCRKDIRSHQRQRRHRYSRWRTCVLRPCHHPPPRTTSRREWLVGRNV